MTMRRLLIALLTSTLLISPAVWADKVYKCKGRDGATLYQASPCSHEVQTITSWGTKSDGAVESSNDSAMVITQGRGGHYFVDGSINGHFLNFIVDTGATRVTLSQNFATSAGLRCEQHGTMNTANGQIRVCGTTIQELKFGVFTLREVEAIISPNLDQPLLGMSVLKRFHVDQDVGEMRLTKRY